MLLLEGIGTIVFGLWIMSQGTEPGASIMIILGLPVVLFGVVVTIAGFARSLRETAPGASEAGREQSPEKRGHVPPIEKDLALADSAERERHTRKQGVHIRPEQERQDQTSRKKACPECGADYGLIDLLAQPTMCSQCWNKGKGSSVR